MSERGTVGSHIKLNGDYLELLANLIRRQIHRSVKLSLCLGQLASTYSLWLWDGDRAGTLVVADSASEEKKWPRDICSRRGNGAFEGREQGHGQAGFLRGSNVGERRWGDPHTGDQNLSTCWEGTQASARTGTPDAYGMTGVFNGSTPLQITVNPDKRFKSLPPAEILPRNTTLGGYIFVCNNDTMQEDLKRQLFGMAKFFLHPDFAIYQLNINCANSCTHRLKKLKDKKSFIY
jgi:hypothetical protein